MTDNLQVLPGLYRLLFLYFEPMSAIVSAPMIWIWPGAAWFHHEQIPHPNRLSLPLESLDPRTAVALWQLGNCYMLVGFMVSFVFRVTADTFRDNPVAQERIVGAILTALAIADVVHVLSSFMGIPPEIRFSITSWNGITHGNITLTTFLFCVRLAWFLGVGRRRFYYGQSRESLQSKRKSQ
ncbi:hypothetical protein F5050DRAFT_1785940 [Lentinula boryana]|uniref:DUF7704 domain-containing protein n=1 Tax=Lentinula boryana TaxID=40481 RepID=A0ABQ8Q2B0_9AGAR|nr:hypothetical protein F5050DRAFT_1785940 [Lentinula boryana]